MAKSGNASSCTATGTKPCTSLGLLATASTPVSELLTLWHSAKKKRRPDSLAPYKFLSRDSSKTETSKSRLRKLQKVSQPFHAVLRPSLIPPRLCSESTSPYLSPKGEQRAASVVQRLKKRRVQLKAKVLSFRVVVALSASTPLWSCKDHKFSCDWINGPQKTFPPKADGPNWTSNSTPSSAGLRTKQSSWTLALLGRPHLRRDRIHHWIGTFPEARRRVRTRLLKKKRKGRITISRRQRLPISVKKMRMFPVACCCRREAATGGR